MGQPESSARSSTNSNPNPSQLGFQSEAPPCSPIPDPHPVPDPNPSPPDPHQTADDDNRLYEVELRELDLKGKDKDSSASNEVAVEEEQEGEAEVEEENEGEDNKNENLKENEKVDNSNWRNSNGIRRYQFPVRPEAEDCPYYMKTGSCKFGVHCKFNHPVRRKNQAAKEKEKVKEKEDGTDKPGMMECKYYLRTGGCKYGNACRYNHSREKTAVFPAKAPVLPQKTQVSPIIELNFLGLPIRLGEKECPYYMRTGSCKFGTNCRFNHPEPTTGGCSDPPSVFGNGVSASLQGSSQSGVASWSSPGALNETAPFVPLMFSPTHGIPSPSPEWNGYQAPIYPPETSMHPAPAYVISNPASEANVYAHQQQPMLVDEFPDRPGQPECSFFLKTGDCKFKSNCKYHHPKNRVSKSPPCSFNDKGLPLRPDQNICTHYSRYGICKFGPSCKFDHPVQPPPSIRSGDDRSTPVGDCVHEEEARMPESGNGRDAVVQQPV